MVTIGAHQFLAKVPDEGKNPFGRPLFQNLQYSDTPTQPLVPLRCVDTTAEPNQPYRYTIRAVNTVGLESEPTAAINVATEDVSAALPLPSHAIAG